MSVSAPGTGPCVLGAGLVALDVLVSSEQRDAARCFLGGSCGNVLAILGALGWQARPLGRLNPGEAAWACVAGELTLWGVRDDFLHAPPVAPVPIIAQRNRALPGGGFAHSFSFRCPRCRRYLPGYQPVRLDSVEQHFKDLPACDVFYLDRPAPGNLRLARQAAAWGALVVFEPSGIGKGPVERHFREALALAHVLKYSRSRVAGLADEARFARTPLLEIETSGETGLRYRRLVGERSCSDWVALDAFPGPLKGDAAGAGDWTTAVTLHALRLAGGHTPEALRALPTADLEGALRAGQAAAAWNCQFQGARGGMYQTDSELSDFVRELTGRECGLRLRRTAPTPLLTPRPLAEVMRKLCPTCRGWVTPLDSVPPHEAPAPVRDGWKTIGRPGYVGRRQQTAGEELDRRYGAGRWRIAYRWRGEMVSRDQALEHYTRAYEVWLRDHPERLDWLVRNASDVYDLAPDDVRSGTDFRLQTGPATHLQDIAVRIALQRLGRRFEGARLIQIRGRETEGAWLSPGVVPFHAPEAIEQPELEGWWQPGSIESFWQSNKVLQVRQPPRRTLLFGGSFNPVHNGHLALARFVRERLRFDRVLFIPNGDNYRKVDLAPATARLAMVRAAVAGDPACEVVDAEVFSPEPLRVVQTTEELRQEYPEDELVLLRGLDALPRTHHRLFRIPGLRVLVLPRDTAKGSFDEIVNRHPHLEANRARLDYVPEGFQCALSSTAVRLAVREGRPVDTLVPAGVAAIIQAQGLYR